MKKQFIFLSLLAGSFFSFAAGGSSESSVVKKDLASCKTWEELAVASRLDASPCHCAYTKDELLGGVLAMPQKTEVDKARKRYVLGLYLRQCEKQPYKNNCLQSIISCAVKASIDKSQPSNIFNLAKWNS